MARLIEATCSLESLYRAWRAVRGQVRRTTWPQLSAELGRFECDPLRHLRDIRRRVRAGEYHFAPKWGYAKRKSGGSRRGVTVHCVSDRIVQRALLNVIQSSADSVRRELGEIPAILDCPTSFAGNPRRGVPEAIERIAACLRGGARWVALSDVKDFFPRIPRARVVEFIRANTRDEAFNGLFAAALETELANLDALRPWLELFPLGAVGVAQGSLLSVLAGNIALGEFDVELNRHGLTTIRYLDDFAILGPDRPAVERGFEIAQQQLARLGMTCYAPGDGSQKSTLTQVESGFDFLGCRVHPDGVSPSRRARRQLLDGVDRLFRDGRAILAERIHSGECRRAEAGYAQILAELDRKIRGWGDAFRFVTNRASFAQIDREIDRRLGGFRDWFKRVFHGASDGAQRRIEGIALLRDTPPRQFGPAADSGEHSPESLAEPQ